MANKKINQLVSKTSILSTDLFGIGDATTGQLFKKTIAELQAAIGGAVISVNGLVGTVVLDTDDIQELATPTNKWFTDARARAAISLTVTGNSGASTYSSGTGVLNVPTYTLAGLGGITASFLSGASGISYNSTTGVISYSGTVYTDSSIRALLSGGTGISYNSTTGAISYSGTVYTDSSVRALISLTTTGTSGASTYNNTTGVINVPEYTLAGLGGISLTSLSGGTGITYNNTTGAISYSGTVYTDASVRALISATGNISYNSTTGVISTSLTQYTDALARASLSLTTTGTSGASTYNSTTGVFNIPQYQAVLTNPVTGTGTTNYHAKFTGSTTIGNSVIQDNGTSVGINGAPSSFSTFVYLDIIGNATTQGGLLQSRNSDNSIIGSFFTNANGLNIRTETSHAILISTSASEKIRVTSAGSVGIGSTSPSEKLEVLDGYISTYHNANANGGGYGLQFYTNGGGSKNSIASILVSQVSTARSGDLLFLTSNAGAPTTRLSITSAGSVGINTTTPSGKLDVRDVAYGTFPSAGQPGTGLNIRRADGILGMAMGYEDNQGNSYIQVQRMDGSTSYQNLTLQYNGGNVLIGTNTNNGEKLYVSGTIRATGTITANSDITLKKNLLRIENALEKVEQINGYTYEFKEDDSKRHAGVIAQEIQTVLPEIVNKGNDGILGVEYGNISALLIEAIKEQQTQINELKALLNK